MPRKPFEKGNKLGKRWPKGVSGNPGGMTKAQRRIRALLLEACEEDAIPALRAIARGERKNARLIPYQIEASNSLIGNALPKPKEEISLEVSGKDGAPIETAHKITLDLGD